MKANKTNIKKMYGKDFKALDNLCSIREDYLTQKYAHDVYFKIVENIEGNVENPEDVIYICSQLVHTEYKSFNQAINNTILNRH